MYNQGQGTYPQLAGSFYNSAQMMPHDNGRNAQQVPTFFTGLQNMMSASTAMTNYQGMPLNQNILGTQLAATNSFNNNLPGLIGGLGTGLSVAGGIGAIGMMAGVGGGLMSTLAAPPLLLASIAAGGVSHAYKQRMSVVEDMKNALQGSRLGYGLADPITGTISNTAAFNLSKQLKSSAAGSGFQDKDLTKVLGQASGLGMLNGMQSLGEVTKRVTDLAKASREIVMLGEGISMTDAIQLQKLTQDMGISTSKFRGKNIGKNLVMAARAAGMSMDEAAQIGGQGAITFQQLGLGAASGMNAAFFSNIAAKGLTGVGAFSQRQLASLGGEQGIANNLLAGQASTMARMSDALVMGSVKLASDGQFRIDRDLLDRYVRGEVSRKDLIQRGKDIGKGMTKKQRSSLLEGLQFQMPELKEQMSDMLGSEEMMTIQGREILDLKKRSGLSMRRAAQAYFGDAAQAETFLGYAQNYRASRAEADRQQNIAQQERMLRFAGMAKSSTMVSRMGRSIVHGTETFAERIMSPFKSAGDYLAEQTVKFQDEQARGLRRIMGVGGGYSRTQIGDIGATIYGGTTTGRSLLDYDREGVTTRSNLIGGRFTSYADMVDSEFKDVSEDLKARALDSLLDRLGLTSGLNVAGNAGASQRLTEFLEGDFSMIRKIGDFTGYEDSTDNTIDKVKKIAEITDEAIRMGRAQNNRAFRSSNRAMSSGYDAVVAHLRETSLRAERGVGEGNYGGVLSSEIGFDRLKGILAGRGLTEEQQEAVIGQAYRGFSKMEGEVGAGFNRMMTEYGKIAGIFNLQQDPAKLDTVALEGGGSIEAKGLSRALSESKMSLSQSDFQKLVRAFADTNKSQLDIGDGGRDSTEAILRKADIDKSRYAGKKHMAGVQRVIDALKQAQLTTAKDEHGKTKTFSLADAFRQGTTRINLKSGTVADTAHLDALERIKGLNDELAGIYGEGASHLVEDLQSGLTLTKGTASKRALETAYRHAFDLSFEEGDMATRHADMFEGSRRKIEKTRRSHLSTVNREIDKIRKLKASGMGGSTVAQNLYDDKLLKLEARRKQLQEMNVDEVTHTAVRKQLFKDFKEGMTDEEALEAYNRDNASILSLGKQSLGQTLEFLANRGGKDAKDKKQRKEAYAKLMQGPLGTELEEEFRNMRSRLTGVTDSSEKRRIESEFEERLIKKARAANIELPGMEKSKSLPKILSEISEGIDQFKKTMQSVAKITNDKGVLTIKLPPAT